MATPNPITPKDAAAVILLKHRTDTANPEIFWAQRNPKLAFLGGFHAFPGGQRDAADSTVNVNNCDDSNLAAMIACAARELFEETGVLIARGAEFLTVGQRASVLDDLTSHRMAWPEHLADLAMVRAFEIHMPVGTASQPTDRMARRHHHYGFDQSSMSKPGTA